MRRKTLVLKLFSRHFRAQVVSVIDGTIVGIIFGTLIVIRMMKKKANTSPTGSLTFRNIIIFRVERINKSKSKMRLIWNIRCIAQKKCKLHFLNILLYDTISEINYGVVNIFFLLFSF